MANTRDGKYETRDTHYARYDALPPEIKRLYAAAPFNFHMARAAEETRAWRAGQLDIGLWRRRTVRAMCDILQARAAETYGPDHPDAQVNRLDRRRAGRT